MTKRFTALLAHLERQEDAVRQLLGKAERERGDAIALRERLEQARLVAADEAAPELRDTYALHWRRVGIDIERCQQAEATAASRADTARAELIAARGRTRAITLLRQRHERAEALAAERRQQRRIDDDALARRLAGTV